MKKLVQFSAQETIMSTTVVCFTDPFTKKSLFEKEIHKSSATQDYIDKKTIELTANMIKSYIANRERNFKFADYVPPTMRNTIAQLYDLAAMLHSFSTVDSQARFIHNRMLPKLELLKPKKSGQFEYYSNFINHIKTEFKPAENPVLS